MHTTLHSTRFNQSIRGHFRPPHSPPFEQDGEQTSQENQSLLKSAAWGDPRRLRVLHLRNSVSAVAAMGMLL